jgi:fimbrial chaperone protein
MKKQIAYALLTIGLVLSFNAAAFRLEPMVAEFGIDGDNASKIFRVENEGKDKIAVKVEAFTRAIDENGKETLTPTKNFKIYPDQISLAASDSRAVRVIYQGPKDLEKEEAYRIVASQLPVSFKEDSKKTGIKFLFQFVASVYVTSDKYYPKVVVESVTNVDKENIRIKLINKGQKHALLKDVKVELKDTAGGVLKLGPDNIKGWDGENLLSGTRRTFKVKSPATFDIKKDLPKIDLREQE